MRNILLALLALCFGAATAAKQALDDKSIRVAVRASTLPNPASANGPPKRSAVAKAAAEQTSGTTTAREVAARNAAAEMIKSKLATQTTRRRLECVNDDSTTVDEAFYGTKCESTSCGVSDCTDAAPARRISVAAAVAALVSVLIA